MHNFVTRIRRYLRREGLRRSWLAWRWVVLGLVLLVTVWLGSVGFAKAVPQPAVGAVPVQASAGWPQFLYQSLQLFVLEYNGPAAPPLELEIARWLALGVAFFAAVRALIAIFNVEVQQMRVHFARGHVVVCGLDRKGWLLAQSFHREGELVVCIERDTTNAFAHECQEDGIPVLYGDATKLAMLRKANVDHARLVYAVTGQDSTNADIAVSTRLVSGDTPDGPPLECVVHVVDPQLCSLLNQERLDSGATGSFRLSFFNIFDGAVEALIEEHSPFEDADGQLLAEPHMLVIGVGRMGEALVARSAREWWRAHRGTGARFHVTLIDRRADVIAGRMAQRYPRLPQACEIVALTMELPSAAFLDADYLKAEPGRPAVTGAYVCLDDDTLNLSTALFLAQPLRTRAVSVMVRAAHETGLATLLQTTQSGLAARVFPFGLMERTCRPGVPLTHERLAMAIHDAYVARRRAEGDTLATNPSLLDWEDLPASLRESNRRQVDHIGEKLRAVGYSIGLLADWDAEDFAFGAAQVETMARMEHDRWVAERRAGGWRSGPEKDIRRKVTPFLVEWEALDVRRKESDREVVRAIPRLLAENGFQVMRA
jgi:hypothetical protein